MKKIYIVANWKSHNVEANEWLQQVESLEKEVVVCPSFTSLPQLAWAIKNLKSEIKLGAQDISPFGEGAYTGEVNGKQIKEFADYVILGHSERRKHFEETDEVVLKKIEQAIENQLKPIICVSGVDQIAKIKDQSASWRTKLKNSEQMIIAYEPLFAIGSGQADTPENADQVANMIKKELGDVQVLYGGSVTADNVNNFTKMQSVDGVLVGKASLDPLSFSEIIKNA